MPGTYRAAPTIVCDAHRPEQIVVAPPHALTVLPLGAESADPYRLTPQELLALGQRAYQRRQWQEANSLLTELLTQWELSDTVYRDTVTMLLDVQLELNDAGQTVKYFEIIRDKWPNEKIPFAKLLRVGAAYQTIGEHERSFLGYRAVVETLFTSETGVPGFLAAKGEFLRSVDVMARLLREYPPEPYTAAARFGLAQQVAAKAPQAADDPELKAAGIGRTELLSRAGRLLEAFLVDHPDDPAADQVAFTAANGLLELGRYDEAASACERYARRYPDSELLDSFWYITGYGRFVAGQPDPARDLLRKVAVHRPIDKATGQPTDSPNKWPAIYILGQIEHSLGRVAEAIQQYRLVEDRFPDARQSIAAFLQKTIRLPELTTIRPGKPVEVLLEYRNLTACEIKVYRIDLAKFALLRRGLGDIAQINLAGIQPLHEATVKLGDGRDYRDRTHTLPLAAKDEGAYLVVCRGDQQFTSGLVLITPLELEVQHDAASGEVRTAVKDVADRPMCFRRAGQGDRQRDAPVRDGSHRPPRRVRRPRDQQQSDGHCPGWRQAIRVLPQSSRSGRFHRIRPAGAGRGMERGSASAFAWCPPIAKDRGCGRRRKGRRLCGLRSRRDRHRTANREGVGHAHDAAVRGDSAGKTSRQPSGSNIASRCDWTRKRWTT